MTTSRQETSIHDTPLMQCQTPQELQMKETNMNSTSENQSASSPLNESADNLVAS